MYGNVNVFYPRYIYCMINFAKIKEKLKNNVDSYNDYGSIIILHKDELMFSVNSVGKVEFYYNSINKKTLEDNLQNVENAFKEQIEDFHLLLCT